jgi:peroxiredoxin
MKYISIFLFFIASAPTTTFSQIPTAAEDISPLLISEKIPDTELYDLENNAVSTSEIWSAKKTVLLFYRGGWCPYCTSHLSAVGEVENKIESLGYQIIGVSPDAPIKNQEVLAKMNNKYQLYHDKGGELMKAIGIAFQTQDRYADMLSDASGGANSNLLPVPSIFIVSEDGTIIFEYICPDYKQRMEADLLLSVLKSLKN